MGNGSPPDSERRGIDERARMRMRDRVSACSAVKFEKNRTRVAWQWRVCCLSEPLFSGDSVIYCCTTWCGVPAVVGPWSANLCVRVIEARRFFRGKKNTLLFYLYVQVPIYTTSVCYICCFHNALSFVSVFENLCFLFIFPFSSPLFVKSIYYKW